MSVLSLPLGELFQIEYGAALKADARDASGEWDVFGSAGPVGRHSDALVKEPMIVVGRKGSVGKLTLAECGGWPIDTTFYMVPKRGRDISLRYAFHMLSRISLDHLTITTSIPGLNRNDLAAVKIPVPGMNEQRRIAAILDKADAIRRKRQQALALADDFLRSAFLEMFGAPVANPRGWNWCPIEAVVASIDAGWSAKGLDRPANFDELGVLKISAVTSGRYRPNENKAVEIVEAGRPLVMPQKGDLLFSRANTRELVAAACIVDRTVENVFLPDKLWRIRLKPQCATPEYLKFVLSDPTFRAGLCAKATGTSGSMLNISQGKLLETALPLPLIDQQQAFSRLFWRMAGTRAQLVEQSENDNTLFASLSQRAFRGEL